jgi:hypothetical protein
MKNDTFMIGTGQAHELALAFGRTGWTNADVKKLSEGETLADIRRVIRGEAKIEAVKHIIDLDADPLVRKGWCVESHVAGGQLEWDSSKVSFYLSETQKSGRIQGHELRKELADKDCFNANLLNYLLANPTLIPDEWKKDESGKTRYIFFWGTVYRVAAAGLCVPTLCWCDGKWDWGYGSLDNDWDSRSPAAVPAS